MDFMRQNTIPSFGRNGLARLMLALICVGWLLPSLTMADLNRFGGLEALRIAGDAKKSRVVLEFERVGTYKISFQNDSQRIVVELDGLTQAKDLGLLRDWLKQTTEVDWLTSVRMHDQKKPDRLKILLNVSKVKDVQSFMLKPHSGIAHYRLVIDVRTESQQAKPHALAFSKSQPKTNTTQPSMDALVSRLMQDPVKKVSQRVDTGSSRDLVIVLDAGHGGKDPGALGRKSRHEKDYTLRYAKAVARAVDKRPGMRSVLTRTTDTYISLRDRVRIATKAKADLFISLHADSFPDQKAHGSSVYALSLRGASSKTAQLMADNANSTLAFGKLSLPDHDPMVAATLVDLAQTASIQKSLGFGETLLPKIDRFQKLHSAKVQQANFHVLRTAEYPAVLVELAFISNRTEEKKLASKKFQTKIVDALIKSIQEFFHLNPPAGSYFALKPNR